MAKPILDKAEVGIDFPDKFYHGSFGRGSRFDVRPEDDGIVITLDRKDGEKRHVEFHLHYLLLEHVIAAIGEALASDKQLPENHRKSLQAAAAKLAATLE